MSLLNKKKIFALAGAAGLVAMLVAPASFAGNYHRHHWHPAGRWVNHRGCRNIVHRRFCRIRHGYRQCYVTRHVRYVCR